MPGKAKWPAKFGRIQNELHQRPSVRLLTSGQMLIYFLS